MYILYTCTNIDRFNMALCFTTKAVCFPLFQPRIDTGVWSRLLFTCDVCLLVATVHLLEAMGQLDPFYNDDQVRLNMALKTVTGVVWRVRSTYGVTVGSSQSRALPFRVAVLPYSVVCRSTCRTLLKSSAGDLQDLHIVHPLIPKGTNKRSRIAYLGYWLLDETKLGRESENAEAWLLDVCTREYRHVNT